MFFFSFLDLKKKFFFLGFFFHPRRKTNKQISSENYYQKKNIFRKFWARCSSHPLFERLKKLIFFWVRWKEKKGKLKLNQTNKTVVKEDNGNLIP